MHRASGFAPPVHFPSDAPVHALAALYSQALSRIASWAEEDAILVSGTAVKAKAGRLVMPCTELRAYIENNKEALIDYGQRHRAGKPISTSRAEGTVNQLVNARMNKRRQMRWSP